MAPDSVSDDGLNIYRGIMNVLELSIKKAQHSYSLQEVSFGFGHCGAFVNKQTFTSEPSTAFSEVILGINFTNKKDLSLGNHD